VIYCNLCDPDPTDETGTEEELTTEVDGEVLAALDLDGEGVPVIAELREDDDVWLGVAKAMAKRCFRKFPAAVSGDGWRLGRGQFVQSTEEYVMQE
jgi:hypothetical protein